MIDLFKQGGPIMWPLLLTSLIALATVVERLLFIVREKARRHPDTVAEILRAIEAGDPDRALQAGQNSPDFVARVLTYGLAERQKSLSNALMRAAGQELRRFSRGLPTLDTVITVAPLLGLLGTVTGMIHAFGLLGGSELEAPSVITGGIAEALIATAYGLGIAIVALLPFNYLNTRLEEARQEIEDAANHVELHLAASQPHGAPIPA